MPEPAFYRMEVAEMAEYKVNTVQLQNYAAQISALQSNLDAVALKLGGMQLGSVLRIKASTALVGKITDCKWAAVNQSNNLGKLARGLEDVAELYANCEKALSDPKTQAQADAIAAENAPGFWDQFIDHTPSWQNLLKWLGSKCAPLAGLSAIFSFREGDAMGIANGIKTLCSAVGTTCKAVTAVNGGGWSLDLMKFFGFAKQDVDGLSNSWNKWVDSMKFGENASGWEKGAVVAKWAGYALTAVVNGIDNYNEYQEDVSMTVGRAVGETIVESAVDIGLSIGAGVLIAAALPATAPAILVGAAAAGVVWVGNEVCEWITGGRDLGEVAADFVCDSVEAVGNAVSNVADAVADGVSTAWNGICNWAGGLFA